MGFYRERFYHIVQTQLGTPILDVQFLAMGTGGSLVWTQCMPCTRCYEQTDSIYDSGASLSYRKLLCSHPLCQGTQARYQCVNDECVYNIRYGGGNIGPTKGVVSVETFRFVRKDGIIQVLDGIIFGCSNDNMNFKDFEGTLISGILGLSWSPDSLAAQLANFVERRFSYCLVAYSKTQAGPSMLTFGTAVPTLIGNLQTTNFVGPPNNQYLFYVRLLDISVGWDRIGFPSDTFKLNYQDGSGGLVIDTGAVMSHFNNQDVPNGRNPYKEVIRAFQKHYDSFNLKRKENETHGFELCYESPLRGFKQFATLTYHFEGANYIVDGRYVNYFNDEEGYFCVALVPGNGVSILGAWQQQNKRIVYNGDINVLQFVDEDCK